MSSPRGTTHHQEISHTPASSRVWPYCITLMAFTSTQVWNPDEDFTPLCYRRTKPRKSKEVAKKIKRSLGVKDTFPSGFLPYLLISTTFSKNDQKKTALEAKKCYCYRYVCLRKQTLTQQQSCVKKHWKRNEINYFLAKGLKTDDFVQLFRILHSRCFILI